MQRNHLTVQSARRTRKSWADQQGIRTGVLGEIVDGINIHDDNRATTYETSREEIELLRTILHQNYLRKEVHALLFGVLRGDQHHYAIFVEDGFIHKEPIDYGS